MKLLSALELFYNIHDVANLWKPDRRFQPTMTDTQRATLYADWRKAVQRAKGWARE